MKPLNQNLIKLTKLLNDGQYHDGTSIGDHLNMTRAAVWKNIKKLEQYAISLQSTKGKGYKLDAPLILLDADKIKSTLHHASIRLDILEKTTSTNEYLKQFIHNNHKVIACLAETQTDGKGRLHRQWYSPFADNIYLSLLYPFEKDISELSGLGLVIGLAICNAIEATVDLKGEQLTLKWPNDVLLNGRKLVGILIEIQAESNGFCQVIIGAGINVNMKKAPKHDIAQPWESLGKFTSQYLDRNALCTAIIDTCIDDIGRFSSEGFTAFTKEWKQRDHLAHKTIAVMSANKTYSGTYAGINPQGHLLLTTKDEGTLSFSSGDTTLLN